MENVGKILKSARLKKNLSIDEVSDATKIRTYVIEAIEEGNFEIMPLVYIKSFIKTYAQFLNIDDSKFFEPSNTKKEDRHEEVKVIDNKDSIDDSVNFEKPIEKKFKKKKVVDPAPSEIPNTDYSEIFKQKKIKSGINPAIVNYIIYGVVALILFLVLYFTFFFDSKTFFGSSDNNNAGGSDTTVVDKGNSLLSYFDKPDSLTITAKAIDTAWLKIEIDGKESEEVLMTPPMEKQWSATEFIVINQGNYGAIEFMRNGVPIPPFGKKGSVVKNIKITKTEVINSSPWKNDSTSGIDANTAPLPATKRYKKKKEAQTIRTIEPASIQTIKPATNSKPLR